MRKRSDGRWIDDLVGKSVGVVPLVGRFLERPASLASKAVREEQERLRSRAISAAERTSGLSREDIGERVAANPRLVPLVTRVLLLAGMNKQDEMLDLLGAALGEAAADLGRADEVDMILAGLTNLRAEHIKVLEMMSTSPRWSRPSQEGRERERKGSTAWNPEALADSTGLSDDVAWQCVLNLESAGFVRSKPMAGFSISEPSTGYSVSPMGEVVLDVLRQHRGT
jgi:hypothetical protein